MTDIYTDQHSLKSVSSYWLNLVQSHKNLCNSIKVTLIVSMFI